MNPTRPGAQPVTWKRRTGLLYLSILLAATPLHAAPKAKKAATPQPSPAVAPVPDEPPVTSKDLQITADDERKADAMASFIEGSIAEDNADLDKALADYRKVLEVDPAAKIRPEDDSDTLTLLAAKVGFELARRGDVAAGIDVLKDTVKASPKESTAYYFLSQLYSKYLKKYDVALKYAEQALELDPQNFVFYVANYELQINLGQSQKAVAILDRAAMLKNDDPQFWLKMSELYIHALVKEDGTCTPDDMKKMDVIFQKTLALAKNDPTTTAKVGDFYVLTKQIKEAIPLYEKVLTASAGGGADETMVAAVREKLASCYVVAGQRDDAIKTLEALIKGDPMRASSYETLGQLYAEKGDYEKALNSYQQDLLLNPNQPMNYLRVSDMMFQLKKFDKAVEMLTETHQKFPDLPRITYALGQALSLAKKHQEAMAIFDEAKAEAENSESEMLDGEFYFDYGAAAEQAGLIQKAADLFKKSIALDPANAARAYNYLGFMWVDRGQNLDEAGTLIKRAVDMDPGNGAYIDSLGWYYFKKGEPEKALPELLKAAEAIKPEDSEVYDHIGDTYQKLGNAAQALVYWEKAVALDPDNKSLADKVEGAKQKVTSVTPAVSPTASPGVKAERQ